jgi:hypothetical protein
MRDLGTRIVNMSFVCRKFLELLYIKTLVTPNNAQFYNLCILSITYFPHVSALSPSSGAYIKISLKDTAIKLQYHLGAK